jgi:2-oxo-4-hydroxy-4-carboxy-5-ureidoimidazoline decarboxylase
MTLEQLNSCDQASFVATIGHVFEHSPWIAFETWSRRPFRDRAHLHAELCFTLRRADPARQLALIQAHPDLAGRLASHHESLTAESSREQASAGLNTLGSDELRKFQTLNEAYRTRFGFPFVICARLNAREAILQAMESRLNHSLTEERAAALSEIEKIAWLRLADVIDAP